MSVVSEPVNVVSMVSAVNEGNLSVVDVLSAVSVKGFYFLIQWI